MGRKGNVPADEGQTRMSLSKWPFLVSFPIAVRKSAARFDDTLFYDVLLNWVSTITITRFYGVESGVSPRRTRTSFVGTYTHARVVGWLKENSSSDKSQRCLPETKCEGTSGEEKEPEESGGRGLEKGGGGWRGAGKWSSIRENLRTN